MARPLRVKQWQHLMLLVFPVFPVTAFIIFSGSESFMLAAVCMVASTLILAGVYVYVNRYNKKIVQDLQNGEKLVITCVLNEKSRLGSGRSSMFFFKIDNRVLKVPPGAFYEFEEKQLVEIHLAPVSEYVIKILPVRI